MKLIYLQEETPYKPIRLVDIINKAYTLEVAIKGEKSLDFLSAKSGAIPSNESNAFALRLKKAMDNGLADTDEKTVVKKTTDGCFSFRFIGLFDYVDEDEKGTERNLTFFFMPKFVSENWMRAPSVRDTVLLAIDRYKRNLSQLGNQAEETEKHKVGLLELAVRVLRDYLENGIYTVQRQELEHNGQGEIDWETTIDQYQPMFLKRGEGGKPRPVYMDYATELAWADEEHYVTRLHQCLVTMWGRKLEELGLSSVLRVNVPLLSEEELDWFGEPDYQIAQIDKELKVQFVTKSRHTLSLMKDLIRETAENKAADNQSLSFGMNGVAQLWERAVKDVFGDQMDKKPGDLGLRFNEGNGKALKDFIEPPKWTKHGQQADAEQNEGEDGASGSRLRPDFIAVDTAKTRLVILDAKYYLPEFGTGGKTISNCPGVGDIDKQFLYQLAFADLCKDNNLKVCNAFVFPNKGDEQVAEGKPVSNFATITVPLFSWISKNISQEYKDYPSENILALQVDGMALFKAYAEGCPLDPSKFTRLDPILECAQQQDKGTEVQQVDEPPPEVNNSIGVVDKKGA